MIIRRAELSDASSLAALSIEVWLGTYIRQGIDDVFAEYALSEFTPGHLRSRLTSLERTIFVSQNVVGIDGMIELAADTNGPVASCSGLEVTALYIQPRHQGSGRGTALLAAGLDHARASGYSNIWLTVNAENRSAVAFYEARAFQRAGETHFQIQDQSYLNYVMRKDL